MCNILSFDIERQRDVIEYPIVDEINCCGWDLSKALYLFMRTNGALLEWLNISVKHREVGTVAQSLPTVSHNTTTIVTWHGKISGSIVLRNRDQTRQTNGDRPR